MADTNENVIVLPFDARGEIERMLNEIDTTSNPVGTAAQIMRLLMSWRSKNIAHAHSGDCMCVMVPTEVEGASECWYCGPGGAYGKPCGDRCDIARAEAPHKETLSMVAHPEQDFPDNLTDFHRGAVFAWRRGIEEFEDRCRDLDPTHAAPYRDAVNWLEGQIERYREAQEHGAPAAELRAQS